MFEASTSTTNNTLLENNSTNTLKTLSSLDLDAKEIKNKGLK